MKTYIYITALGLIVSSLLISCGGGSDPDKFEQTVKLGWVSVGDSAKEGDVPHAVIKESSTRGMTVNFTIPGIKVYETKEDNIVYHHIDIPEAGTLGNVGVLFLTEN